ncbi:ribonuclease M5 [Lutispora thermophila]|uniref:Ribonuclease M5 n=1 Tax=Lutispora thermophila DSM 19022 TaxID=1122184 RepID=A0A1M6BQ46_9FIRM|nr:ribonuclease M5 [Lutispora thermophila]SHI50822.1 ribonuclease M5 [Lutispora thermophila DSM 19022]
MIKECIVVEGKNDAAAVKRAVDADIIITSGFGITGETLRLIRTAADKRGVIVLTDPDFMGEKIRKIIGERIPGVKHAFIPREEAMEEGDVGVENASPESIIKALSMARYEVKDKRKEFTHLDMVENGLVGCSEASDMRAKVGKALGIGYANGKQFLNRLNNYGITREEFYKAIESARRVQNEKI